MKVQQVRGTRDFYPEDMALRNWIFERWRRASRRAGFVEVDGPELEPLELYTEKSGPEIAEQLYWLDDKGGRRLALRPEFTPTLARMIAARQAALPEPIRWFNISRCFRYERAQKGRLREFFQWNVDLVGIAEEIADAECISLAVDAMKELGLGPEDVQVRINDRRLLSDFLCAYVCVPPEMVPITLGIIDKRDKVPLETWVRMASDAGLTREHLDRLERLLTWDTVPEIEGIRSESGWADSPGKAGLDSLKLLFAYLRDYGIAEWCRFDIGIVRGLAYYTGPVWEVHDRKGELRAIFGGGRYDRLLGDMGGKTMPACGFGCGDVVLGILLGERGLRPQTEPAAEFFVASAIEANFAQVLQVVRHLRARNRATQFDLKGGNLKRQMKKAADAGARFVVIVGEDFAASRRVKLRDMSSGDQRDVGLDELGV